MRATFHRANNSQWIWTIQAENWRIVGRSSESYHNKQDCINNFEQVTGRVVNVEAKVAFVYGDENELTDEWQVVFDK